MFKHCLISTLKQIFEIHVEYDVYLCFVHFTGIIKCAIAKYSLSSLFDENDDATTVINTHV